MEEAGTWGSIEQKSLKCCIKMALFCRAFTVLKAALNLNPAQRVHTVTRRDCPDPWSAARVAMVSTVLLQDRLVPVVPVRLDSTARPGP